MSARNSDDYLRILDEQEQKALELPDRLFALSYLRGHLALIAASETDDVLGKLLSEVESAFEVDKLSIQDKELVYAEIKMLERS